MVSARTFSWRRHSCETWQTADRQGTRISPKAFELPRDLTPGDYDAPVFSLGGQEIRLLARRAGDLLLLESRQGRSHFDEQRSVDRSGELAGECHARRSLAKTRNITPDNPASDSTPLYSPDGKYIAYRAQQRPGYESDRFRLMLYDRKTGEKKSLTETLING